jgi:3-methyladenine DNA glycosylase/8-oxoguanine DNA glycosylase
LRGAGGEPISFARTVYSHGCARLAPAQIVEDPLSYRRTLRVGKSIVSVTLTERDGGLDIAAGKRVSVPVAKGIERAVARMFRFDDDLAPFYALIAGDERLGWAAAGAGRLLASPSVFEDTIKTICTTNCAWSATVRMTDALVALGAGAFPEPELVARTPDAWFKDIGRMGYRGPYIKAIARDVAGGTLDLESLRPQAGRSDGDVEETLLGLPGIGPYGAAHVMQLLGRHRNLVLDSWTRPSFLRIEKKKQAKDSTIRRAFAKYGNYAGLAFWLTLTRGWTE